MRAARNGASKGSPEPATPGSAAEGQEERLKSEAEIDSFLREKEEIEKWAAVGSASMERAAADQVRLRL
jgi:hypothetical protein